MISPLFCGGLTVRVEPGDSPLISGMVLPAFRAQVHSTAPALTLPTPVYPAALPLLTMRKAVSVPESEAGAREGGDGIDILI